MATPQPASISPDATLAQLIFGKWVSMAISVAAKLRIADKLHEGPKTVAQLATECNCHAPSLHRLMRALASVGVFKSDVHDTFHLTPVGQLLRSGVKGSLRGIADYCGSDWSWKAWGGLHHSIMTGETAFDRVFGEPVFDYLHKHPDESAVFNEGMTGFSGSESALIARNYAFAPGKVIVDVGGGHGHLLATILSHHPQTHGVLFDAEHVIAGAGAIGRSMGVEDRIKTIGGDFFHTVPAGGDYYIMKHIIHDWNDADCARILLNLRTACKIGTKLLLAEMVIPIGDGPHPGKLLDLEMLCVASGKERTEHEYRELLSQSGFELNRIISTESPLCIVEATAS